ncbi:monocarboxylate transporter 14 [Plakobranchus ocellatus]|uniref:Monocarboxylate transporter 14 n=1 Tax=Plakobranchus ocellatus TaxID=259542 RepID=A0AAV4D284_9GAST|nr:monocarboxylate transporter 14 [Plakobranchus ocellatus]
MEGGVRGLVIVFSAFMIQVLAFGNYACIGIYTVYLLEEFDGNAVGVSLISSIHYAVLLGFGPVTSSLMGFLSIRKLCLAGAALVSIGIFCMPLFVFLPTMYLFFGVFAGLGGCLIYLPSHVLSGLYYDKYRSLAVGVATAGQGMSAIVMPLVVGLLIKEFTWRGSLFILAGLHLHLFIFALLMVPPPDDKTAQQLKELSNQQEADNLNPDTFSENFEEEQNADLVVFSSGRKCESVGEASNGSRFLFDKLETNSEYQPLWEKTSADDSQCTLVERPVPNICPRSPLSPISPKSPRSPRRRRLSSSSSTTTPRLERRPSKRLSAYLEGKIHRRQIPDDDISNIFIPSYYSWFPEYQGNDVSSIPIEEDCFDTPADAENPAFSGEAESLVHHEAKPFPAENPAVAKHHTTLQKHLAILLNFKFGIYFISTLLWSMTTALFGTFGPDSFVMKGHSAQNSTNVITFYGVGQFVGCIIVSILGSFVGKKRMLMFIVANVLTGVFMALMPFFSTLTEIALMLVCLGLVYGGILGLYMIVMVDIVGTEDMDIGLGYIMLGSGVGCFTGPPIGGAMLKTYGNYNLAFYMSGAITVVAGLIMGLVYPYGRCRNVKKDEGFD